LWNKNWVPASAGTSGIGELVSQSTPADVLTALRALHSAISARSEEIEQARRLPADVAESLIRTKVFKLAVPAAIGGVEGTVLDLVTAIEEMSQADGATGWCVMISGTSGLTAAYLKPEVAKTIHGAPNAVTGGIFAPRGKATKVDGGYRVSGTWQWASGSSHCDWMKGGCVVYEDGKPKMLRDGVPDVRTMYFPREKISLHDNWYSSGLCGSGSCDMTVSDLFVPDEHTLSMISGQLYSDGPLYRFPLFGLLAIGCGAVALGIARGAIEDVRELAGAKTPTLSRRTLAERGQVQSDVAKAHAGVASARAWLIDEIEQCWELASRGDALKTERRAALRLVAVHAVDAAVKATDICYTLAGGTSVYRASPLQRRFRDIHVVTQHMMVAASTYELAGRVLLGLPTDPSMA
jgi:alkylation response protein AidB-like acyl-CoA dehydrogenase